MTDAERDCKRLMAAETVRMGLSRRHTFQQGGKRVGDRDCACGQDRYAPIHKGA